MTMSSIDDFSWESIFDFEIPNISCLLRAPESFLESEESFPLDEGLKAGNSSIFFSEFFLIKVGLL